MLDWAHMVHSLMRLKLGVDLGHAQIYLLEQDIPNKRIPYYIKRPSYPEDGYVEESDPETSDEEIMLGTTRPLEELPPTFPLFRNGQEHVAINFAAFM